MITYISGHYVSLAVHVWIYPQCNILPATSLVNCYVSCYNKVWTLLKTTRMFKLLFGQNKYLRLHYNCHWIEHHHCQLRYMTMVNKCQGMYCVAIRICITIIPAPPSPGEMKFMTWWIFMNYSWIFMNYSWTAIIFGSWTIHEQLVNYSWICMHPDLFLKYSWTKVHEPCFMNTS